MTVVYWHIPGVTGNHFTSTYIKISLHTTSIPFGLNAHCK